MEQAFNEIHHRIDGIISDVLDRAGKRQALSVDKSLIDDLGMSSMELLEVVLSASEEFSIELNPEELYDLVTMNDVYRYVDSKVTGRPA